MTRFRMLRWLAGPLLAGALALAPVPARAWGNEGHKIIATVAYAHLTPAVRERVGAILREGTDTLTELDVPSRATWADKFRDSDRNTSKQRYRLTREWHFVDLEIDGPDLATACFDHPPAADPREPGP